MRKLLLLLLCVPLLVFSQEDVTHNLIGWTTDNKIVYKEESSWHVDWEDKIIVQNLITDKIEDVLAIGGSSDGYENEFLRSPVYIYHNTYKKTEVIYPYSIIDSIFIRDSTKYAMCIDNFLRMYKISKKSISLHEDNYIEDYDLKITLSLSEAVDGVEFDVLVGNQSIGYKTVGSGSKVDDVTIKGYYISPLDSRVLIVIETNTMHYGEEFFEGMENEMKLYYFGCSLNPSTFH